MKPDINVDEAREQRHDLKLSGLSRRQFLKISPGTIEAAAIADRAFSLNLLETNQPDLNYDQVRELNHEHRLELGIEGDLQSQRADRTRMSLDAFGESWAARQTRLLHTSAALRKLRTFRNHA